MYQVSIVVLGVLAICVIGYQEVYGQIPTGPQVVASLEHDGSDGVWNSLLHYQDDYYILLYVNRATCYLKTFEITDDAITQIDSETLGNRCTYGTAIVKITDSIFAIAYPNTSITVIETYTLDSNGNINTRIDQVSTSGRFFDMIKFSDTRLLLAYYFNGFYIRIITVDSSGDLTLANSTVNTGNANTGKIFPHDEDTFLAASGYTRLSLNSIDVNLTTNALKKNSGTVQIDSHSVGIGIERLSNNTYIVGYVGASLGGAKFKTYTITNANTFLAGTTKQLGGAENITTSNGGGFVFEQLADNRVTVAYPGASTNGQIVTLTVDGTNGIQEVADSRATFSTHAKYIAMVRDGSKTVLAYAGLDGDGYIALIKPPEVAPGAGTLTAHAQSASIIRFTFLAGTPGTDTPKTFDLQCREPGEQWRLIIDNSPIPSGSRYNINNLQVDTTLECQWRNNSDHGKGPWSNTASATTARPQYQDPPVSEGPVKEFEDLLDSFGGLYFGMSLFPFIVMIFGCMATTKTTGIFTIITLMIMGIIHSAGYYEWPEWYWSLMILFAIPLVLSARR